MKIPHDAWVLVLDGEKFLLLRNQGDEDIMDLRIIDHEEVVNPPTRSQGTDRPGRMPDDGPGMMSAMNETDWHALEKERFADDMADRLRKWAMENRFERIVVVADPRSLGELRKEYHQTVRDRIAAEIDKDLTNMPVDRIEAVLRGAD